jgi:hypothetical protein
MTPLICRSDQAMLSRDALGFAPQRCDFDAVDAIAPRIPLNEPWLVLAVGTLIAVQLTTGKPAHFSELRLELRMDVFRQDAVEIRPQDAVVVILIPELGRRLDE